MLIRSHDQSSPPPNPTSQYKPSTFSRPLSNDRIISSIPRAFPDHPLSTTPSAAAPANSETSAPSHTSGNWVYPSEAQFFHAVLRKHSPEALLPPDPVPPLPSTLPVSSKTKTKKPSSPEDDLASTIPTHNPNPQRRQRARLVPDKRVGDLVQYSSQSILSNLESPSFLQVHAQKSQPTGPTTLPPPPPVVPRLRRSETPLLPRPRLLCHHHVPPKPA